MDPLILALMEGVVSHAIYALIVGENHTALDKKTEARLQTALRARRRVSEIIGQTQASVARAQGPPSKERNERIRQYLVSPEVEALVLQLIGWQQSKQDATYSAIEGQFRQGLKVAINIDDASADDLSLTLIGALNVACEDALQTAIDEGVLSAHEIKSIWRHRDVLAEFSAISRKIDFISHHPIPDIQGFIAYERKYRLQIAERHKYITPPHLDTVKKVAIDDLYVSPRIAEYPLNKDKRPEDWFIDYESFVARIRRTIPPRSGRSGNTAESKGEATPTYGSERETAPASGGRPRSRRRARPAFVR